MGRERFRDRLASLVPRKQLGRQQCVLRGTPQNIFSACAFDELANSGDAREVARRLVDGVDLWQNTGLQTHLVSLVKIVGVVVARLLRWRSEQRKVGLLGVLLILGAGRNGTEGDLSTRVTHLRSGTGTRLERWFHALSSYKPDPPTV